MGKERKEREEAGEGRIRVKAKLPEWKLPSGSQRRRWRKEREEVEARVQPPAGTPTGPAAPRPIPSFARFQEQRRKDYEARIALEKKKEEEEKKEEEAKKRQEEEDKRKKKERNKRFAPTSAASGSQEEPMEFDNTRLVVAGQANRLQIDPDLLQELAWRYLQDGKR